MLLNGPMGAGKSTLGPIVAARAGVPFVDLDDVVRARAGAPSVGDLFERAGELAFRALEAEELRRLLPSGRKVVALGGGTLTDAVLRREALERAKIVSLAAEPATLVARTAASSIRRPALEVPDPRAKLASMITERAAAYAECHGVVATDARSIEDAAEAVLAAWRDPAVPILLGARSYAVRVAADVPSATAEIVRAARPSSVVVVTDERVRRLALEGIEHALERSGSPPHIVVELPAGERHKTLASVETILRVAVTAGADRSALVLAVGGGVVSDIAGFAAAVLLRGVRWAAVPTTLLAMVDASTGGKTGVDLGPVKNAVGAFHQPAGVVAAPAYTLSQPPRDYAAGLAEVVKAAAIRDAGFFEWLETNAARLLARDVDAIAHAVEAAVSIKARIVAADERESGERVFLNFGHTLGHALEAQGGFERWTHGEAVSLGMVAALRIGVRLGVTPAAVADRVVALLSSLGLPVELDREPLGGALSLVGLDKKRAGGAIRFVLLAGLGTAIVRSLTLSDVASALALSPP